MTEKTSSLANAIPSLSSRYSGVPDRLVKEAVAAKERLFSQKTSYESSTRANLVLPPGTSQDTFDKAIAQLRTSLGQEHVELNDKPLVDGWYLEHPSVCPANDTAIC